MSDEMEVRRAAFGTVIGDFEVTGKTMEEVRDTTDDEYEQRANCGWFVAKTSLIPFLV